MLGKLIKHEFSATARYFLPLFVIALVLTPITRFTVSLGEYPGIFRFIPIVIVFAYVASLVVIVAASVLLIIHRFYKSMVTEEGYLMHTLPVSIEGHIFSKLIVASVWSICSFLVIVISLFMMFFTPANFSEFMRALSYGWSEILQDINASHVTLLIIECIILMVIGIISSPLVFYAAIAIGQVIAKNKVLGSVIGFFIIQFVSQVLGGILLVPFGYFTERFANTADNITQQMSFMTGIFFPVIILMSIATTAILFGITDYIFKNKLNLE
ncbi:MAG: hypothetical protein PWP24_197 [Clostridiales bacterium]|nr:hypothetical protein [Clostridiales bacterium]